MPFVSFFSDLLQWSKSLILLAYKLKTSIEQKIRPFIYIGSQGSSLKPFVIGSVVYWIITLPKKKLLLSDIYLEWIYVKQYIPKNLHFFSHKYVSKYTNSHSIHTNFSIDDDVDEL